MTAPLNNRTRTTALTFKSLEGLCSDEETRELAVILAQDAEARDYYYDSITAYIGLNFMGILSELEAADSAFLDQRLWQALSEIEKSARVAAVSRPSSRRGPMLVEPVAREKPCIGLIRCPFIQRLRHWRRWCCCWSLSALRQLRYRGMWPH